MKFEIILKHTFCGVLCALIALIMLSCSVVTSSLFWGIVSVILLVFAVYASIALAKEEIEKNTIKFCLLDTDAMLPEKRIEDAGYDIYACFKGPWVNIAPNETVMIPTGIASVFDESYVAVLKERGSTGTKGMGQRAGIIDSGYRNEWLVPITNHNDIPIVILKEDYEDQWLEGIESHNLSGDDFIVYPYNKAICQMLLLPVPNVEIKEITQEELLAAKSERGMGKLGSSGK